MKFLIAIIVLVAAVSVSAQDSLVDRILGPNGMVGSFLTTLQGIIYNAVSTAASFLSGMLGGSSSGNATVAANASV